MSSVMATFPEWSDDDSTELDDFLSKPWPDENVRTNDKGWPEFHREPKWRHFSSSKQSSKIVRIAAIPSDERDADCRDDFDSRNDWSGPRDFDDDDDDESVLTLSSLAGSTVELATMARPTTPTKPPQLQSQRLLRQKLPMLLCKSERIKQPSPGDKRVYFAEQDCDDENTLPLDPIIEIGVDSKTEKIKIKHPVVVKPAVVLKPPRIQQQARSSSRPEQRGRSSQEEQQARSSSRPEQRGRSYSRPEQQARSSSRPEQQAVPRMMRPAVQARTKTTTSKKQVLGFQEDSRRLEAYSGKCSPSNWIHNANLFEDKTLPSNTLDFFCRDSNLAIGGSVPSVREVSYSEEDTVTTTSQSTGSGISSLPSGAVDEKLAQVFSLSSIHEEVARDPPPPRVSARDPPARRHYAPRVSVQVQDYGVDASPSDDFEMGYSASPRNLHDYHLEPSIDTTSPYNHQHSHAVFSHAPPSGAKVADRQKWLNAAFKKDRPDLDGRPGAVPVTKVHGAIEKFGGRASRVNAVQQKKAAFERSMAEKNKNPPTTRKTKWEGRPGSYKKKVVLSSYH